MYKEVLKRTLLVAVQAEDVDSSTSVRETGTLFSQPEQWVETSEMFSHICQCTENTVVGPSLTFVAASTVVASPEHQSL